VTHQITSGDSPGYHLFTISLHDGKWSISIISYINESENYEQAVVKLDEVLLYSEYTKNVFGVSPKMHIKEIIALRKNLKFGTGQLDNYLGENRHGVGVTKEIAINVNPQVDAIIWPYPRWR